jgi:hypothetical protein
MGRSETVGIPTASGWAESLCPAIAIIPDGAWQGNAMGVAIAVDFRPVGRGAITGRFLRLRGGLGVPEADRTNPTIGRLDHHRQALAEILLSDGNLELGQ